ncbi:BCL-6 corepressor-like protein 1 [Lates japonicus]|uniref:BCL-6 corepressor-like protein 1 n=1 Tax=Lates japonicus TaxID=270547 RepID=A0AAD3NG06_LATJO|nr:BCL-6 corepressor-like protein 1 [Lates japonicus]
MEDLDEEGIRERVGEAGRKPIPLLHHVPTLKQMVLCGSAMPPRSPSECCCHKEAAPMWCKKRKAKVALRFRVSAPFLAASRCAFLF